MMRVFTDRNFLIDFNNYHETFSDKWHWTHFMYIFIARSFAYRTKIDHHVVFPV